MMLLQVDGRLVDNDDDEGIGGPVRLLLDK